MLLGFALPLSVLLSWYGLATGIEEYDHPVGKLGQKTLKEACPDYKHYAAIPQ
jgi:hypothetical protein